MTHKFGSIAAIAVLALVGQASTTASADTIQGVFNGSFGDGVSVTGGFSAVALRHTWTGGTNAAAQYNGTVYTFCMDRNQVQGGNPQPLPTFTLGRVTDAPNPTSGNISNPSARYTTDQERRLNAVMTAARNAGYLNSLGQFNTSAGTSAASAIQALVWESLWEVTNSGTTATGATWNLTTGSFQVTNRGTGTAWANGVSTVVNTLITAATSIYNDVNSPLLVRALISGGELNSGQDQAVMVPLPPAAFAGLGTLAGVIGIGYIRRRRLPVA